MPAIRNPFARLYNQLVKALNEEELLPKLVVYLPEKVLIEYIDFFGFGISSILDMTIGWMVTQFNRSIDARFQRLAEIKMGYVREGEPKLIWMKIINSPTHDKALAIRSKFNAMLEEKLSGIKGNYIMDVDAELANQRNFFDRLGNLNEHSKEQFWRALDQQLRHFSRCRDEFKPQPVISMAYNARLSHHGHNTSCRVNDVD